MHFFDYQNAPVKLLTPEITALLSAIHEFKGKQELYLNAKPDVLNALMEIAKVQSTTSSNPRLPRLFRDNLPRECAIPL